MLDGMNVNCIKAERLNLDGGLMEKYGNLAKMGLFVMNKIENGAA
jgi:hypothetical protein